ncbi:MAG: serine/threonine protein kinase [Proteobacteria bacterium]|nr:serine/threonine protein kinase [Pseudomonadota bacterium]
MTKRNGNIGPGSRIGVYEIGEKIARGGFGIVWRARHTQTGEVVAIKVLHAELMISPEIVGRFEREAHAMTLIRHPNVVELYECGKVANDGRPYFVMEYLRGVDLEAYICEHGALTPEQTLQILEPMGEALTVVHNKGIIHRDLKALNVFLAEENGERRVVILDFGIAKLLAHSGPKLTETHHTIGSPAIMAPEQIRGHAVDPRTDVYALGSLAFQMLTGELPFPGVPAPTAVYMNLLERRPRPSERVDISPVFDEVVVHAMSKDMEDRYVSAVQFVAAFRAAVEASKKAGVQAPEGASCRALALYVDVHTDDGLLDEPDESLLDDMEGVVPLVADTMVGYLVALERGNSALFVYALESDVDSDVELRQRALSDGIELFRALGQRPGGDPRVRLSVELHVGEVVVVDDRVVGGPLLDLASWVPEQRTEGVLATGAMLEGIEIEAETVSQSPFTYFLVDSRSGLSQSPDTGRL